MSEDQVILRPIVERCDGFGNTRLHGLEVVLAPPHVCLHILGAGRGEEVCRDRCAGVLVELATNGYPVEILPRSLIGMSPLDYTATN